MKRNIIVLLGLVASMYAVNALADTTYQCPTPSEVDSATQGKFQSHKDTLCIPHVVDPDCFPSSPYWQAAPRVTIQKGGLTYFLIGQYNVEPKGPYSADRLQVQCPDGGCDAYCHYAFAGSNGETLELYTVIPAPRKDCKAVKNSDNLTFTCK